MSDLLNTPVAPDWEAFISCIRRQGTPNRVHLYELFLDAEIQQSIVREFHLNDGVDPDDPFASQRIQIKLQRFLGYDFVCCPLEGMDVAVTYEVVEDYGPLQRSGGRLFVDEHAGPITNWEEFGRFEWPDGEKLTSRSLEFYQENLPDDMCLLGGLVAHYAEWLSWLMGYETLCYALAEDRELIAAIVAKANEVYRAALPKILQFDRVKGIVGSDDMGFRTGTLISPDDLREFVLPGHSLCADFAHAAGHPYILHSCGKLDDVLPDLFDDVRIDAKHSYEDTIITPQEFKRLYGHRVAVLGGIDVDFLCRSDEAEIRQRVRDTLDACQEGGGYCLGTGNTVCNYIPVRNYLVMLDEGRRYLG